MSGGVAVVESVDERVRDSATPHLVPAPQPVLGSGECYSPTRADFTFIILALGHLTSTPRRQQHTCVISETRGAAIHDPDNVYTRMSIKLNLRYIF